LGKNWTVLPHLRAKQLSLLSLSVTEGATNWGPEGYRAVMKREVERFTERKKSAEELIESGSPAEVKRAQGQLRYVTGRLEKSNGELEDWDKGGTNRNTFVYSHRTLDKTLEEHEATKQLYELALTQIAMLESKGGFMPVKRIVPSDSDSAYAGAHTCIPCHRPQHLQWSSTPHASAYQSLVDENRQMDRECYDCHVTGAGHPDGPSEPGEVGPLQDVQCEACHGPSKVHSLNPVDVKPIRTPPQTTCTACHDGVRDEGRFDWSVYLPRVAHGAK
jgi:hypothetical protein